VFIAVQGVFRRVQNRRTCVHILFTGCSGLERALIKYETSGLLYRSGDVLGQVATLAPGQIGAMGQQMGLDTCIIPAFFSQTDGNTQITLRLVFRCTALSIRQLDG
jgi:hypothetical protein